MANCQDWRIVQERMLNIGGTLDSERLYYRHAGTNDGVAETHNPVQLGIQRRYLSIHNPVEIYVSAFSVWFSAARVPPARPTVLCAVVVRRVVVDGVELSSVVE